MDRHANANPNDRDAIERAIFPKLIDYRRDVKRGGRVTEEEQARMQAKIAEYNAKLIKQRWRNGTDVRRA